MTKKFEEDIKNFISDRIWDFEDESVYVADLGMILTDDENKYGAWMSGTEGVEYIKTHWEDASETFEQAIFDFGEEIASELNPFSDPGKFTFFMLDYGVRSVLNNSSFIDDNWNEEVELTEETIKTILSEIGA